MVSLNSVLHTFPPVVQTTKRKDIKQKNYLFLFLSFIFDFFIYFALFTFIYGRRIDDVDQDEKTDS